MDWKTTSSPITVRDYFAARAPEVADWFLLDFPEARPEIPKSQDFGFTEYDPFNDDDPRDPTRPTDEQRAAYKRASAAYELERDAFYDRRERWASQKWPYAWADLMLKERAKSEAYAPMEVE